MDASIMHSSNASGTLPKIITFQARLRQTKAFSLQEVTAIAKSTQQQYV